MTASVVCERDILSVLSCQWNEQITTVPNPTVCLLSTITQCHGRRDTTQTTLVQWNQALVGTSQTTRTVQPSL